MLPVVIFAMLWGAGVGIVADQTVPEVNKFGKKLVEAGEVDHNKDK